ncbi:MAG: carboxy-S-adenosyl-L-methionine synthase CmoA [Paraglaciecola sp.]|uniref:carboxy-S-adenosyl-L-methionine synthase CmoA n=1 Tax=Pseudomonadati TaxID=3379134 RepID=UPI00273E137B|nr:carboxy-S-adenosyl-L-methionine synthase CmoA [Paraglaciecola sp.]MDP5029144.1 carboxy-S-adenosyl-L-methionine synthase CmoA [Paraglaciecola sp.]MDP5129403.1 carboxy-S-adenosyl-L-methionine synthase CmoA [Paraglaciecola sp.]
MFSGKDAIYSQPQAIEPFRFDQAVAEVFPDMIQRSVPGYATIIDTIGQLVGRFAQDESQIYDLGCSLGAASLAASKHLSAKNCRIIAVDNSAAMVERCRLHTKAFKSDTPIEVVCDELQHVDIHNASVVIMNFTLQFIHPEHRSSVIARIFAGLKPGGILVLSEKLLDTQLQSNELLIDLHHEFKRRNGYSDLEISQKRSALEDVMRIESFESHQQRLLNSGFSEVVQWFKCFNFASMVAIK